MKPLKFIYLSRYRLHPGNFSIWISCLPFQWSLELTPVQQLRCFKRLLSIAIICLLKFEQLTFTEKLLCIVQQISISLWQSIIHLYFMYVDSFWLLSSFWSWVAFVLATWSAVGSWSTSRYLSWVVGCSWCFMRWSWCRAQKLLLLFTSVNIRLLFSLVWLSSLSLTWLQSVLLNFAALKCI